MSTSNDNLGLNVRAPIGYRLQASDTDFAIERRLVDMWRGMSIHQKADLLLGCCRLVEQVSVAGVRMRHPRADEREVFLRSATLRLGSELVREVYGWDPATGEFWVSCRMPLDPLAIARRLSTIFELLKIESPARPSRSRAIAPVGCASRD